MISNLEPLAPAEAETEYQPPPPFVRPIGDDHASRSDYKTWGDYIVARLGSEFQIGDFLIRRFSDNRFLIWTRDGEMAENRHGQLESALQDLFNEEF